MKKLEGLQWLRAIAALAVVAFHVEITMAKQKYFGSPTFPLATVGFSGVHLFFVLSGFVIFWAHSQDIGRPEAAVGYIWKRFRRLMPPLWVTLLPLFFVWLFYPAGVGDKVLEGGDFFSAFLVYPVPTQEVLDVEWTLRHEVAFYLVFAFLLLNVYLGCAVLFSWFLLCFLPTPVLPQWLGVIFAEVNILFLLGSGVYFFIRHFGHRVGRSVLWFSALLWVLAIYFAYETDANVHGRSSIYIFGLPSAVAVVGAVLYAPPVNWRLSGLMGRLGDASYAIYLVHFPVISVLCKISVRFADFFPQEVWFVLIFFVSVFVGYLFHAFVERPIIRWASSVGFFSAR